MTRPVEGGDRFIDLTAFQRELMMAIADLDSPHGLGIKAELETLYRHEVYHGRLYPNLDTLVDKGLVEKRSQDERTNEYDLTDTGEAALRAYRIRTGGASEILCQLFHAAEWEFDGDGTVDALINLAWDTDIDEKAVERARKRFEENRIGREGEGNLVIVSNHLGEPLSRPLRREELDGWLEENGFGTLPVGYEIEAIEEGGRDE